MTIDAPVIFLPGTLCDERLWMPLWRELNFNQKAYVPLQWAETFEQMLMLTQDRVSVFEQSAHLVGFSMGGFVASRFCTEQPEKVASLTLIGSSALGLTPEEITQRQQVIKAIDSGRYQGMGKFRLAQMLGKSAQNNNSLIKALLNMNADLGAAVLKAHINATTPRPAFINALAQLTMPVHLIGAEQDKIAPIEHLQQMHSALPGSSLHRVADCGHMLPMEQPKILAKLMRTILLG